MVRTQGDMFMEIVTPQFDVLRDEATPSNYKITKVPLGKPTTESLKHEVILAIGGIFQK
ncbi:hypothetical protein KI387_013618, partial [Taxus chinensis]